MATLPELQRTLIQQHDLQGQALSAAGRSCGLTPSATYRAYRMAIRSLRHHPRLRALAKAHNLDQITDWYRHVGLMEYNNTWMSSAEAIAFWREDHAKVR